MKSNSPSDEAGIGLTGNVSGPWRTIIRFDVATPVEASDYPNIRGDVVAQVLFLKLLR